MIKKNEIFQSYLIGAPPNIYGLKLYAQVCSIPDNGYSIRIIEAKENEHHSAFRVIGKLYDLDKRFTKEDIDMYNTDKFEAEAKLAKIANENKWEGCW